MKGAASFAHDDSNALCSLLQIERGFLENRLGNEVLPPQAARDILIRQPEMAHDRGRRQVVRPQLPMLVSAGSNPVARSRDSDAGSP